MDELANLAGFLGANYHSGHYGIQMTGLLNGVSLAGSWFAAIMASLYKSHHCLPLGVR